MKNPWEYSTTVIIPHRNTPEWLSLCVRFWQKQKEKPFLLIVDTGSDERSEETLRNLSCFDNIEVARLGVKKTEHPVDGITAAMDYGFSRCPTPYLLATHTDLFPRHPHLIDMLLSLCGPTEPVVGWEMSPRGEGEEGLKHGKISDGFVGHVCTIFHMATMDRIGAGWSIRRASHLFGHRRLRHPTIAGWPDTETCLGEILKREKIQPLFLGRETNHENQWTDHWVHARSRTAMGEQDRHGEIFRWAEKEIEKWESSSVATSPSQSAEGLDALPSSAPGDC